MKTFSLDLPALYGDHHVLEVRRILLEMPGVSSVYASSAFHFVEISYNPDQITEDAIEARLEKAGYLGDLPMPAETGVAAPMKSAGTAFYRSTSAFAASRQVGFTQQVPFLGRPLWPCPGIGVMEGKREE